MWHYFEFKIASSSSSFMDLGRRLLKTPFGNSLFRMPQLTGTDPNSIPKERLRYRSIRSRTHMIQASLPGKGVNVDAHSYPRAEFLENFLLPAMIAGWRLMECAWWARKKSPNKADSRKRHFLSGPFLLQEYKKYQAMKQVNTKVISSGNR